MPILCAHTLECPGRAEWQACAETRRARRVRPRAAIRERSLVRDGRADLVLDLRRAYQETMRDELVAGVEEITGRRVIAFLSANHIDPDVAIESFVLAPRDGEPQPRAADSDA